jgi:hypothetical protein
MAHCCLNYAQASIKLMLLSLDSEAELEPVNEQPNHQLVHLNRFRKADGFSH